MSILDTTLITTNVDWNGSTFESITSVTVPSGTNQVIVLVGTPSTVSFNSIEFGGNAMSLGIKQSDGDADAAQLYTIASPATGANDLVIQDNVASNLKGCILCISETTLRTPQGAFAFSASSSNTLTTVVGDLVMGLVSNASSAATSAGSQTDIMVDVLRTANKYSSASYSTATTTSTNHSYTIAPSGRWASVAIAAYGAAGLSIDSTDATMQRNTDFQVVCSTPSTTPTTGNTTLTNGNDTLTPTSVTGSDPYTLTFPVGDLSKQVDATGYDWTLTVDAETATTGNIPLVIQAGYTLVDLVDPVTTNASLLFGVTGDTPVTGDHLEYDVTSTLDSGVSLSVAADGVWTVTEAVDGDWVTDITVDRRVVQADGTIGTTAEITLSPSIASDSMAIVKEMVSNIVSEMVN